MGLLVLGLGGGGIPPLWFAYKAGGWGSAGLCLLVIAGLLVGLRASIVVSSKRVVITKKWFLLPYRRYTSPFIVDVFYSGGWDEPEGASGVAVKLPDREVVVGSGRSMHYLHSSLQRYAHRNAA